MRGKNFTVEILPRRIVSDDIFRRVRRTGNIIESRSESEYQARRKRDGGINFYDLGLYFESQETIYKSLVTDFVTDSLDLMINYEPIDDTDRDNLIAEVETEVFDTPRENWKSVFSRIEKNSGFDKRIGFAYLDESDDLQVSTLINSDKWTTSGLNLTDQSLASLYFFADGLCFAPPQFVLANAPPTGYKITNLPDIDASSVEFSPSKKMDIFLMPNIIFSSGFAAYRNGLHTFDTGSEIISDLVRGLDHLNAFHSTFPRDLYLEYLEATDTIDSYQIIYNTWRTAAAFPDARALRGERDFAETPPYSYFSVYNPLSPNDFPFSAIYTPGGIVDDTYIYNEGYDMNIGGLNWKRLMMVIEKDSLSYYFWKTTHD